MFPQQIPVKNQKSHLLNTQWCRYTCKPDLMQRHSAAGQNVVTYVQESWDNCCSSWKTPSSTSSMRTKHWGLRIWAFTGSKKAHFQGQRINKGLPGIRTWEKHTAFQKFQTWPQNLQVKCLGILFELKVVTINKNCHFKCLNHDSKIQWILY